MGLAFRVAYDGRRFHGFQRQPDVRTVEGTLLAAVAALGLGSNETTAPDGYAAAGRTDAGVSALAQTIAFDAPAWLTPHALNGELPDEVWSWASADAPLDFHARHDAHAREYRYFLWADGLSMDLAQQTLDALSGEHDFHNLTTDDEHTVRDLDCALDEDGDFLVLTLTADGFPRALVRRVASLVRAVASGESALTRVDDILGPAELDGRRGIPPAPAYPLVLSDVTYDLDFSVDEDGAASARAFFHGREREAAARARVAGFVTDAI